MVLPLPADDWRDKPPIHGPHGTNGRHDAVMPMA
jgi:hypothetical protein